MSSGIRIWGPNGNLQLDENSFTVRVVYSALVTSAVGSVARNVYIPIPEVNIATHVGVCLPNEPWRFSQDPRNSQFDVQIMSGGVTVWFANRNMPNGKKGVSTQRLLVFRYR